MSFLKALMVVQPRGNFIVGECDVPFPLPSDTRKFKLIRRNHYLQRRAVFSDIESALMLKGVNGTACLKRMICEAQAYVGSERKSFIRDILAALFSSLEPDFQDQYGDVCHDSSFTQCSVSIMSYILASILPT